MDAIFEKSLADSHVNYSRYSCQPSIFNTILWYGIAETETSYQVAFYSFFDTTNRFSEWIEMPKLRAITKEEYQDIKDLAWFSKDYFSVTKTGENNYLYNDLRYPLVKTKQGYESVFSLLLYKEGNRLNMKEFEPKVDDFNEAMFNLWERIQGI